jgi:uncharacterized protein (TIGR03437 family)
MVLWRRLVLAALWVSLAAAQTAYVDKVSGVGVPTNFGGDFGPATQAQLNDPTRMALDRAGNLYIADESNARIRKIAPNGTITTLAGAKGFYAGFFSGEGGPALAAGMDTPYDVALDAAGNLYIAAFGNSRILKVDGAGTLTTFAGIGLNVLGGDGGAATSAGIGAPAAVAADANGNLYLADYTFGVVRRVFSDGTITTVAGTGVPGYSGDNGSATSAQLRGPVALAVAGDGTIYIADFLNSRVRAVNSSGTIRTVAGTGVAGYSGDGGLATSAQFNAPSGLSLDENGNLYIADSGNHRVRKVTPGGVVTTVAGTGTQGFSGDGSLATSANLDTPMGVLADAAGNLYIADSANNRIRLVDANGAVRTIAGSNPDETEGMPATWLTLDAPSGVAVDSSGAIYVADWYNHRVRKVTPDGLVRTVAGTGVAGFSGDGGEAKSAQLYFPFAVALDGSGNVYISDQGNNRVRRVGTDGVIRTVAGNGTAAYSGDNGAATNASLNTPAGIAVDSAGNLYIADYNNARVRKVSSGGTITTMTNDFVPVGLAVDAAGSVYATDVYYGRVVKITSGGVTDWSLFQVDPYGVAVDAAGNVYVAEMGSNRIRKITPQKVDTHFFPVGTETWTTSTPALSSPFGVAVASNGTLYIADNDNARVLQVRTSDDSRKRWPRIAPTYILNSATFIATPVSAGELVTVYGDDLGPITGAGTELDGAGLVSKTLGGAQVFFDGVAAPVLYAQAGQVNAVAPYTLAGKSWTEVWVVRDGLESNHVRLSVLPASPGVFATSADFRLASALNQDNTVNDVATNPAPVGNVIVLFATGGGQTDPAGVDGLPASGVYPKPQLPVSVRIGGVEANVLYAGAAPGFVAGALQINAIVPAGLASIQTTGGYIAEVIVTVGGVPSRSNLYIGVKP